MNQGLKEEILTYFSKSGSSPKKIKDLYSLFRDWDYNVFEQTIKGMEGEGILVRTKKKNKITTPQSLGLITGTLLMNKKGFGFIKTDLADDRDIFIPQSSLMGAMDGDMVLVKIIKDATEDKNPEGYIVKILTRNNAHVVGRFQKSKDYGFVIPLSKKITQDIYISKDDFNKGKNGDFVKVEITNYAEEDKNPEGKIIQVIGTDGDKDIYFKSILAEYDMPLKFPKKVRNLAKKMPQNIDQEAIAGRKDFRDAFIFTIDGWDAKDLDDAISIKKLPSGNYELGVHIADVSEYVTQKSPIDEEALKRATSVYLVNTVIPMLPEELSNGICSLHPDVERLCLSCIMEIDKKGKVVDHQISKSVIISKRRLVYSDVSDFLEKKRDPYEGEDELKKSLTLANELALILMNVKKNRGAMDFDFPESSIQMDPYGEVINIEEDERRIANKIIEEFMLITNETVATEYFHRNLPFVYRVHEKPSTEKIESLSEILASIDYNLKVKGDIHPMELQKMLDSMKGKKEEPMVSIITLRSMQKALYSSLCLGHFSLALRYYCHFTSPIRRYPDLQIHRIIKLVLDGNMTKSMSKKLKKIVNYVSEQSSIQEERADEIERDVDDLRKAQYMKKFIGEKFIGTISSITSFGIFVMLDNTVEGLVRFADLHDDYYELDEANFKVVGQNSGKVYHIGDKVEVVVAASKEELREIDFVFSDSN